MPLHKIPNVPLGKTNTRHVTRMVFPRLYEQGSREIAVPSTTLSRIYDECIRPAIQVVCSSRLSHWPPSYIAALANCRDARGKLHFKTIDLSHDLLDGFVAILKTKLSQIPKLEDVYFMHEVRGTKGFTIHDPADPQERWECLHRELNFLDFGKITSKDWYIDVGLEVYLPNHVLQWLTDAHPRLLHFGLPKQARNDANSLDRLLNDPRHFFSDLVAQFREFAGFRSIPLRKGLADSVVYLNVYTTDKEPTYQLHAGSFRKHNPSELLQNTTGAKLIKNADTMMGLFGQCMGDAERAPNEGSARYEVRVALSETPDTLVGISNRLLRDSIVAIPVDLWWSVFFFSSFQPNSYSFYRQFKFTRLAALRYVLDDRVKAAVETRALRSSLVLGAVGIWMLNALNFRPNSATQFKALADACCQQAYPEDSNDSDDPEAVPYNRGIYFLADILEDTNTGAWRAPLPMSDRVDDVYLTWMYGRASMAILEHDAGTHRVLAPKGSIVDPSRIPNRRQKTTAVQFVRDDDLEVDNINLHLADRGVTIRPVVQEGGRDVDVDSDRLHPDNEEVNSGPDDTVAKIWKQASFDIFAVSPNGAKSTDPSHIIMSVEARQNVTWDTFKTTDFSGIFEKIQIRMVTEEFWTTTLFDRYFPPQGTPPKERGKLQNFPYTTYYNQWFKLMSQLSPKDAKVVRSRLLKEFKKLKWLPHGGSDRMWATSQMSGKNWTIHPIGSKPEACPQIAVNSMKWGRESIKMGTRRNREEEEMEEDLDSEE